MRQKQLASSKSHEICKSNYIIQALYNCQIEAMRIMLFALYNITTGNYREENHIIVNFKAKELKEVIGISGNSFFENLYNAADALTGLKIFIKDPQNQYFRHTVIVVDCTYDHGELEIRFDPSMKPYLINLTGNYTKISLESMVKLKRTSSFRLYEILKSYCYKRGNEQDDASDVYHINLGLNELRFKLGAYASSEIKKAKLFEKDIDYDALAEDVKEKKHAEWDSFNRRVLIPAIKEINEKTLDMSIHYMPIRSGLGGKVTNIEFTVNTKVKSKSDENKIIEIEADKKNHVDPEIKESLKELTITNEGIENIAKAANNDPNIVKNAIKIAMENNKPIRNMESFLLKAINENWELNSKAYSKSNKAKPQYKNFEQRKYDFNQLERELFVNQ